MLHVLLARIKKVRKQLDNFISVDEPYPVIVTTSELFIYRSGLQNLWFNRHRQRNWFYD